MRRGGEPRAAPASQPACSGQVEGAELDDPPRDVASVLQNLDFREKGGYMRAVVPVHRMDASGPPVQALVCARFWRILGFH